MNDYNFQNEIGRNMNNNYSNSKNNSKFSSTYHVFNNMNNQNIFSQNEKNDIELKSNNMYNNQNSNYNNNDNNKDEDDKIYENHIKEIIKVIPKEKRNQFFTDEELNSMDYKYVIEIDNRSFFQYYWSLLKKKHLILSTFCSNQDYNIFTLKFALFLISFCLYFCSNGFFFSDSTMHKIYKDEGVFKILYQIPQILYSSILTGVISFILRNLSLSQNNILKVKQKKNILDAKQKSIQILRCLKIKFVIFFLFGFLLLLFFWYYLAAFCAVYQNTQKHLVIDTLTSFGLSMVYPFGVNLLPGTMRFPAINEREKKQECLYKISKIVAFI